MTCKEYQQLILTEDEPTVPVAVREHLAECVECLTSIREDERLQVQIQKLAQNESVPPTLREQVRALVQSRGTKVKTTRRVWAEVAAAAVFLTLLGYGIRRYRTDRTPSPNRLAQEFIADHLHYLPGREEIVSDSARDVEKWFQERVDFAVRVPRVPAAELQDARVCNILGRKAALLHFRRKPDSTLISLFVAEEPKAFERQKEPVNLSTSFQGLNSTLWCHRGLVYSLVAALDDASLKQVAESVRQQEP